MKRAPITTYQISLGDPTLFLIFVNPPVEENNEMNVQSKVILRGISSLITNFEGHQKDGGTWAEGGLRLGVLKKSP